MLVGEGLVTCFRIKISKIPQKRNRIKLNQHSIHQMPSYAQITYWFTSCAHTYQASVKESAFN